MQIQYFTWTYFFERFVLRLFVLLRLFLFRFVFLPAPIEGAAGAAGGAAALFDGSWFGGAGSAGASDAPSTTTASAAEVKEIDTYYFLLLLAVDICNISLIKNVCRIERKQFIIKTHTAFVCR